MVTVPSGNKRTIAATGTNTPHTATNGCSHLCQAITQQLSCPATNVKRPVLLRDHYCAVRSKRERELMEKERGWKEIGGGGKSGDIARKKARFASCLK